MDPSGGGIVLIVYKYFNPTNAKLTIENDFLKLSAPCEFNDPYEIWPYIKKYTYRDFSRLYNTVEKRNDLFERLAVYGFKYTREEFSQKLKTKELKDIILTYESLLVQKWIDTFQISVSKIISICCFTLNPTNLLMWSHYGFCHEGIVLGFDFTDDPVLLSHLMPVQYHKNNYGMDIKYCYGNIPTNKQIGKMLTWKNKEWEYEKEIRLIMYKEKLDSLNEYISGIKNCTRYLKHIILGFKTKDDLIEEIREKFEEKILIQRCGLKRDNYSIKLLSDWEKYKIYT